MLEAMYLVLTLFLMTILKLGSQNIVNYCCLHHEQSQLSAVSYVNTLSNIKPLCFVIISNRFGKMHFMGKQEDSLVMALQQHCYFTAE